MTRRRILQAGDTGKAVCEDCATIVPVTYCYRDLPFRETPGSARDILAGACDHCGAVVLIPAQSFPHIRYWLEKATPPVRLMISRAELEILDAADRSDPSQPGSRVQKFCLPLRVPPVVS